MGPMPILCFLVKPCIPYKGNHFFLLVFLLPWVFSVLATYGNSGLILDGGDRTQIERCTYVSTLKYQTCAKSKGELLFILFITRVSNTMARYFMFLINIIFWTLWKNYFDNQPRYRGREWDVEVKESLTCSKL